MEAEKSPPGYIGFRSPRGGLCRGPVASRLPGKQKQSVPGARCPVRGVPRATRAGRAGLPAVVSARQRLRLPRSDRPAAHPGLAPLTGCPARRLRSGVRFRGRACNIHVLDGALRGAGLVRRITPSATAPAPNAVAAEKTRKSCWRRAGRGLLTVSACLWAGSRRGRGMDSVTRGSGIALGMLVAATASVLLLVPGKPAGSWRGPGPPGQVVMASAAATLSSGTPRAGSQSSASSPGGQLAGRVTAGGAVPPERPAASRWVEVVTSLRPGHARPPGWPGPDCMPPSARSAPSAARVRAVIPIPRNPPGSALMSSNVMPCSTARSWPVSSRATQPGPSAGRYDQATRRASTPTASPCSPSPRTLLTRSRTRSSSRRRSFPRSATRIGFPALAAVRGGPGMRCRRMAPDRGPRRPAR